MGTNDERYDYVVVGAGSAGCAVAGRLSEDPDVRVAVLEAGPPAAGRLFDIPRLFGLQFKTSYDWDFQSEPEPRLDGRRNYLPRGRVVGGTSSMNTQLYVRGNRADYDAWAALGLHGWSYDEVLPFFKRSEDNERGEDAYHGVGGPLRVSDARSVDPLLTSWIAAAQQAGHPLNDDFNGERQDGVGAFQLTQKDGLRWSSADAFLGPAASRANLTVLPLTLALRLVIEGDRVVGVEIEHQARTRIIGVEREAIVSAGTYLSPQVLMLSGIGPADALRGHGIEPHLDLADVGEHLQDHPGCFMSLPAVSQEPLDPDTSEAEALLRDEGTGPMTWTEVGGFARTSPAKQQPDIQFHAALGVVREEGLSSGADLGLGFGPYVGCPKSRGRVTLRSAVPQAKPHIFHNYLDDADDLALLRVGMRMAMEIGRQPALTDGTGLHDLDGAIAAGLAPASDADADIDRFVRQNLFSFYHPTGTCSMGRVVDDRLRVRGMANLRVADASVIPLEPIGNLNAPVIMIGERAADFIRTGD